MELQMIQDLNNHGIMPPISFNTDPTIGNKPHQNQDSLKVKINTNKGDINKKTVLIFISIFNTSLDEAPLKIIFLLEQILKYQNLNTGSQCYVMIDSILSEEQWFQMTLYKWLLLNITKYIKNTQFLCMFLHQFLEFFKNDKPNTPSALLITYQNIFHMLIIA